jgi:diguanylate cyclase (GGDEF)-like protein
MGSLRRQSLVLMTLTMIVFMAIGVFVSRYWMERSMREFESHDARQSLQQVTQALGNQLLSLRKQARDYAVWNTTFDFMQSRDPAYIGENYSGEIFNNIDSDYLIILRADGRPEVVIKHIRDGGSGRLQQLTESDALSAGVIAQIAPVIDSSKTQFSGSLFWFNGEPYLYAYSSILNNQGAGPPRGVLAYIRKLSPERLQALSELTEEPFQLKPPVRSVENRTVVDGEQIISTGSFRDTENQPVAQIEIRKQRPLQAQISMVKNIININSLILTLLALAVVYVLFDRIVLRKIDKLVKSIGTIRTVQDQNARVELQANTDIDRIAGEVNHLLDDLRGSTAQLQFDAMHDHLTGLGNRKLLLQALEAAAAGVRTGKHRRAVVLLMDLDAFKDINDLHGHLAGDFVLKSIAERLVECAGETHTAIRIGGDEFACVIDDFKQDSPDFYAEQMLTLVSQPMIFEGIVLSIHASIGVVVIDSENHAQLPPIELLRKADIAMYASKQKAKNSYQLFDEGIEKSLSERKRLELDLAAMIAMQSFDLRLQPIVHADGGKAFVIEVLARWQHPEFGNISPNVFIAMAESAKLMARFDRAVIQRACALLAELRQEFSELRLSINISATTLLSPGITGFIKASLSEHQLPRNALLLEITESMLASDEHDLVDALHGILGLGVQFMIDDFGTGYSSLSRLNELPLDYIKIDRSFLNNLERNGNPMCQAIIQLAHSLGMKVVAEGVETAKQQRLLTGLGCDYLQGFHIAAPMSMQQLSAYLRLH